MKKRICSLFLALSLAASAVPAFAADAEIQVIDVTEADSASGMTAQAHTPTITDPTDTENPAEPTDPVTPTEPTEPTTPTDPVDPVEPVTPVDPVDPAKPKLATAKLTLQGSKEVHVGNHIYMHATVSGMGGTVENVTVAWYVGTKQVSKEKRSLTDGDTLDLKYQLPKNTSKKSRKVTIKLTKGSSEVSGYQTVDALFDFVGASLAISKTSDISAGKSVNTFMTLNGLKEDIQGSYLWYVDGKKVGSRKSCALYNGKKFTYKFSSKKTGKHTVKLVLKNEDGSRVLKQSRTITVHDKYAKTLATYTTYFDASNTNRSTNLRLAIKSINGTVLQPGDTFSFNGVVGERTAARGYKTAIVFEGGQSVPGLGGGICQVSSTLFNAALMANQKIVERHYHSATISYVPLGRDATVAYGSKDFKFRNNKSVPVKIEATYNSSGSITVALKADYGTTSKKVTINVTRSGSGYCLRRYVDGKCNYTTYSYY